MNSKLVTIGCSYTQYFWPTWATYLGLFYDNYYNYGLCGAGNTYIFTVLSNKIASGNIKQGDTVVIQWSSLMREDRILTNNTQYIAPGNIKNQHIYSKEYVDTYFNPIQKVYELISYITAVRSLAKDYKFTLKMFYMLPPWFSDFLGEPTHSDIGKNLADLEYIESNNLLEGLKIDYKTKEEYLPISLEESRSITKPSFGWQNYDGILVKDPHPSPYEHLQYVIKFLLPSLNVPRQVNIEVLLREAYERSAIMEDQRKYTLNPEHQLNRNFPINKNVYSKLNFEFDIPTSELKSKIKGTETGIYNYKNELL